MNLALKIFYLSLWADESKQKMAPKDFIPMLIINLFNGTSLNETKDDYIIIIIWFSINYSKFLNWFRHIGKLSV